MAVEIKEINWRIPFALRNYVPKYMNHVYENANDEFAVWHGLFEDGNLVAMARTEIPPRGMCTMNSLFTMPEYRGKGYGTKLAEFRIDMLKGRDIKTITRAVSHYEKLGFVDAGIVAERSEGVWHRMISKVDKASSTAKRAIIVDIDETIVDKEGMPITPVLEYIEKNRAGKMVIVVTARHEDSRPRTEAKLDSIGLKYDVLHMSTMPSGAHMESKQWRMGKIIDQGILVEIAIDDDPGTREMYKGMGVQLVIDPGEVDE